MFENGDVHFLGAYYVHTILEYMTTLKLCPQILRNLEYVTESEKFVERYDEFVNTNSGLAKYIVENLLRKRRMSADPRETDRYVSLFIDYAANLERCTDERK